MHSHHARAHHARDPHLRGTYRLPTIVADHPHLQLYVSDAEIVMKMAIQALAQVRQVLAMVILLATFERGDVGLDDYLMDGDTARVTFNQFVSDLPGRQILVVGLLAMIVHCSTITTYSRGYVALVLELTYASI